MPRKNAPRAAITRATLRWQFAAVVWNGGPFRGRRGVMGHSTQLDAIAARRMENDFAQRAGLVRVER